MKNFICVLLLYFFRIFKIKKNKVVVESYYGKGYGDNPKYICESLHKMNPNLDIVWLVKSEKELESLPNFIRGVKLRTIKQFYELSTAKIWIDNSRKMSYIRKRKNQFYLQTWHGGIPLKKIEFDAIEQLPPGYVKNMINDNKMIDLMVSNSKYTNDLFINTFKYNGRIICDGIPRNDKFVNDLKSLKENAKSKLNITSEKVLLYAPTFRNEYPYNPYDIDFKNIKKFLEEKYETEWIVLIKLHPSVKNPELFINISKNIVNVSNYQDTQELEAISDIIITDYSSLMFEGLEINKPVILYMKDYNDYIKNNRELYFDLKKLPFKIAYNNDELIKIIRNNDFDSLKKDYTNFKHILGINETGKSSDIVAKIIIDIINK